MKENQIIIALFIILGLLFTVIIGIGPNGVLDTVAGLIPFAANCCIFISKV